MWAIRCGLVSAAVMVNLIAAQATAHATASRDVSAIDLWTRTQDGLTYTFREITLAPGGSTGWHTHPGRVYAVVKDGTLTHNVADCSIDGIYETGAGIFEPEGITHIGRNLADTPLVLQVLYILPAGSPPTVDQPDPGCGFG